MADHRIACVRVRYGKYIPDAPLNPYQLQSIGNRRRNRLLAQNVKAGLGEGLGNREMRSIGRQD